jgi:hypothetical protein
MTNSRIIVSIIIFILFATQAAFAQVETATTTDSTHLAPQGVSPQIQCYELTINGDTVTSTNGMQSYTATFDDATDCEDVHNPSNVALFATWSGGGTVGESCPIDHPYYHAFSETWGVVWGNGGTAIKSARCCTTPKNTAQAQYVWRPTNSSGLCP